MKKKDITWVFVFQKYDQFLKRFHSNIMELFPTQKTKNKNEIGFQWNIHP